MMCGINFKSGFDFIYFCILFILLVAAAFSAFFYPPISDYWEMFYSFHHLQKYEGVFNWLHILNFDVCGQMSYRPLSHLIYYILHLVFGAHFIFFNIFNFLIYFINVYLLYRFSLYFCKNRKLSALFTGLFVFLFTHFDIVLWSCHIHLLLGFSMFFLVFFNYISFLKTNRKFFLPLVVFFSLIGMWCYEAFFLWPLSIIIISWIDIFDRNIESKRLFKLNIIVLCVIYFIYFSGYIFTRSLGTYEEPLYKIIDFLSVKNIIGAGFLVLFNVLYNNILVNLYPFIPFPLDAAENIYMAGPVIDYISEKGELPVYITGVITGAALIGVFFYLFRRKYMKEIKIIILFLFLMVSHLYTIFLLRVNIDTFVYGLTEFRYQYIANAFLILIVVFIMDRFWKRYRKRTKQIIYLVLALILIFNLYCAGKVKGIYDYQLENLKKIISNINMKIKQGEINENRRLYIDSEITDYLPSLCWNIEMGEQYIKEGTYQWMFSKNDMVCFSKTLEGAHWVIDKNSFNIVKKALERNDAKVKKIKEGKQIQYIRLGGSYNRQGKFSAAEIIFKKAIDMGIVSDLVYEGLGICCVRQGKYDEAEELFKKTINVNPNNVAGYVNLSYLYNWQKRYDRVDFVFNQAIKALPNNSIIYDAWGVCYRDQNKYQEAEVMFRKAIGLNLAVRLNHENIWAYSNLKYIYEMQGKQEAAEKISREIKKIRERAKLGKF